jgi:hypothetical protein
LRSACTMSLVGIVYRVLLVQTPDFTWNLTRVGLWT